MYRRTVVANDGSPDGQKALAGAIDLARKLSAELHMITVEEQPRFPASNDEIAEEKDEANHRYGEWQRGSVLGRTGRLIEPAVRPLGWDWRVGMAALASFPAREVVVGTLGIIYNEGQVDPDKVAESGLGSQLRKEFGLPTALSLMVFFALCCQCVSTLAVIRRETRSWAWPIFTFVYMTALAYLGALATFQIGTLLLG